MKAKEIELKKTKLEKRVSENSKLIKELQAKKDAIYETTKDFKLSANKTDGAISEMRGCDSEIKKIQNKINRDKISYSEL